MSPVIDERAARVQEVFADALERSGPDRVRFLATACGNDGGLRSEIEALLTAHDRAGLFLESPPPLPTDHLEDEQSTVHVPPSQQSMPARIGHYHVRRLIGHGGMGAVYEAIQEHPRRIVAVKVMKRGLTSRTAMRRFEHESELLGRLHHAGIAQVYEAGTYDDGISPVPFFAMEYITGARSLTEFARLKNLGTRERLELFARVCDAAHHGHLKGVIHRDLKPSNILVDSSGQPKIIDFGVARATDADLAITTLATDARQIVGTLQYMSPEQAGATDAHDIDARSDVYSLGVVLYELLCARLPYDLSTVAIAEATRLIREAPPPPPGTIDHSLRGDLDTIILKALHKERERRYQSAADLKDDVDRYLAGEPIHARRDSISYLVAKRTRSLIARHDILSRMAVVVIAVLATEYVGFPLLFDWTPCNTWFERALAAVEPPAAAPSLDRVRVVAITDATPIEDLAKNLGLTGVSTRVPKSLRRLHGEFMRRLALPSVHPRSLVWDLEFLGDTEFDADFAKGADALNSREIRVIVVAPTWSLDSDDLREASRTILPPLVRLGGSTLQWAPHARWELELAVQFNPSVIVPSIGLAAIAAAAEPKAEASPTLVADRRVVEIRYAIPSPGENPGIHHNLPGPPTTYRGVLVDIEHKDDPEYGIPAGAAVGKIIMDLPSPAAVERATVRYEDVFTATESQLSSWFDGRFVIVGDMRRDAPDFFDTADGRRLHGSYGHAVGIASLLSGLSVLVPDTLGAYLILGGAGVAGILVPSIARRSLRGTIVCVLVLTLIAALGSVPAYRYAHYVCDPFVPVFTLTIATLMSWYLGRDLLSHRLT